MKNVYCIRKGKALVVTQTQFVEWFTDNFSAELITKEEYQIAKAKELDERHCMNSNCRVVLNIHEPAYCMNCEHENQHQYHVEETNF